MRRFSSGQQTARERRCGQEEEEEYFEITISGKTYYTDNETNGTLYEITPEEEVGKKLGVLVNGKAKLIKK